MPARQEILLLGAVDAGLHRQSNQARFKVILQDVNIGDASRVEADLKLALPGLAVLPR